MSLVRYDISSKHISLTHSLTHSFTLFMKKLLKWFTICSMLYHSIRFHSSSIFVMIVNPIPQTVSEPTRVLALLCCRIWPHSDSANRCVQVWESWNQSCNLRLLLPQAKTQIIRVVQKWSAEPKSRVLVRAGRGDVKLRICLCRSSPIWWCIHLTAS